MFLMIPTIKSSLSISQRWLVATRPRQSRINGQISHAWEFLRGVVLLRLFAADKNGPGGVEVPLSN